MYFLHCNIRDVIGGLTVMCFFFFYLPLTRTQLEMMCIFIFPGVVVFKLFFLFSSLAFLFRLFTSFTLTSLLVVSLLFKYAHRHTRYSTDMNTQKGHTCSFLRRWMKMETASTNLTWILWHCRRSCIYWQNGSFPWHVCIYLWNLTGFWVWKNV